MVSASPFITVMITHTELETYLNQALERLFSQRSEMIVLKATQRTTVISLLAGANCCGVLLEVLLKRGTELKCRPGLSDLQCTRLAHSLR